MRPAAARLAVAKDLLDTYQAKLRELLDDAAEAAEKRFVPRAAETSAQAAGYWRHPARALPPGPRRRRAARAPTTRSPPTRRRAVTATPRPLARARRAVDRALDGFVAAPFTAAEEARRAQQLLRFLELVPVEYGRGVKGERVTLDFEIAEAVGFRDGAAAAFADLKGKLARRDRARTDAVEARLGRPQGAARRCPAHAVAPRRQASVEGEVERATGALTGGFPAAWKKRTDDADFDLIDVTLDQLDAAVSSGQWRLAEQARLEAYAFIEFGPELKLRSFDPGLAFDIEGLIWFGARGHAGLAELIATPRRARRSSARRAWRSTRACATRRRRSARARAALTVVTNAAILVFREGLEAVLILAAITASMVGVLAGRRRPVMIGAAFGLVASIITWLIAQVVLSSLTRYGEKLEAVVGLVAIAVLLLVMNWFFHKVYWTEHIRKFHKRRKRLIGESDDEARASASGRRRCSASALLGLTSVYREGFETVLFLQSLELATDAATVVEGALLGLALTGVVAVITFKLQRKLPYKRMLIATGVLLAFVLLVMVGTTARTLQGIGWLPITPHRRRAARTGPARGSGVFPTWESLSAQAVAMIDRLRLVLPGRGAARQAPAAARPAGPARRGGGDRRRSRRRGSRARRRAPPGSADDRAGSPRPFGRRHDRPRAVIPLAVLRAGREADDRTRARKERMTQKRWTLVVVCVATAMLMLDIAVVNTALSQIAEDLGRRPHRPAVGRRRLHPRARRGRPDRRLARRPLRPQAAVHGRPRPSSPSHRPPAPRRPTSSSSTSPAPSRASARRSCSPSRWRSSRRRSPASASAPARWPPTARPSAARSPSARPSAAR